MKNESSEPEHDPQNESVATSFARLAHSEATLRRMRMVTRLRNYFLTGLVIVGPVGITVYIAWWFINVVDAWVKPFVPDAYNPETYLPFALPGVGLIFAITGLIMIGALAANLFGRTVISYGEMMLGRMPVVRSVYRALKQIFETVLSQSNTSFQTVGLVEYPRKGLYAIVFISTDTTGEISAKWEGNCKLFSVFLPTTPNPTSGYLLFVPEDDIVILEMSVEDAAKMVISAGLVTPPYQEQLAELAEEARTKAAKTGERGNAEGGEGGNAGGGDRSGGTAPLKEGGAGKTAARGSSAGVEWTDEVETGGKEEEIDVSRRETA